MTENNLAPAYDVVFIDDESTLCDIFRHFVRWKYKDWRYLTFSDSVKLYQEIVTNGLAAAVWVVDIMMPGKNGAQIAEAIRATHGDTPAVLAYTALDPLTLSSHEQYRDGIEYFDQVINKRDDIATLLSLVENCLHPQ
jgi:CheY-like chemotaxis protein